MIKFYDNFKAVFVFFCIILNTIIWGILFFLLIPVKLCSTGKFELMLSRVFNFLGTMWISFNNFLLDHVSKIKFKADIPREVNKNGWYLVISNHQTWSDIFLLQRVFNKKAPFLKFFIKKQLIWVPVIGLAWWALDFPFMKRFSKDFLRKNPHMKGKDMETTKIACEKFKYRPVAVMNFPEGTRNRNGKASKLNSPFEKLIRPKAGGLAFVLEAMDGKIQSIVNVTISYSSKSPSLMEFLSGRIDNVHVEAELIKVEDWMVGQYSEDMEYRDKFQLFVNKLWEEKNNKLIEASRNLHEDFQDKPEINIAELKN